MVLIDNGSRDPTQRLLARLDGFVILANASNEGFLLGANRAAGVARGRHLLFLNSDAFVRPGALARSARTLESDAGIGAVGAKIVLPTGQLQEAGCQVWSDGRTSGRLRGDDPDSHEANRRVDVDYCSGAFLMTPRATWTRFGGFDDTFAPGYYEEVDYCMRLRRAGLRIVYEPEAVVDHFEFGSQSRAGEALLISERNRVAFQARHGDALRDAPPRP